MFGIRKLESLHYLCGAVCEIPGQASVTLYQQVTDRWTDTQ